MTIQDLSRLTGLSIDVLRVWERRYGALQPKRLPNQRRDYGEDDVRRAKLLREARLAGHAISRIATLDDGALSDLLAAAVPESDALLIAAMIRDIQSSDSEALHAKLEKARSERSAPAFCDDIASPLLREVGEYWLTDAALIAREHLTTAAITRVLTAVKPADRTPGKAPLLFATIPPERHIVGAAMAAYVAEQCGFPAIVVSAGATVEEIASTAAHVRAAGVGMSVIYYDAEHTVRELSKALDTMPLWVGGAKAAPGPWKQLGSMREFAQALATL